MSYFIYVFISVSISGSGRGHGQGRGNGRGAGRNVENRERSDSRKRTRTGENNKLPLEKKSKMATTSRPALEHTSTPPKELSSQQNPKAPMTGQSVQQQASMSPIKQASTGSSQTSFMPLVGMDESSILSSTMIEATVDGAAQNADLPPPCPLLKN